LSALNRPDEIPKVFNDAIGIDGGANGFKLQYEEQLTVARRMREGLVKSAAVVGLPKVCIDFVHLFTCIKQIWAKNGGGGL
jgi:hypothetical protein